MDSMVEAPSEALLDALDGRLPWLALAPYWAAAQRHGIEIRTDDPGVELALRGIAEHLIQCANGSDAEAQVLLALMGDRALQFFTVMAAESVISHVVSRGPEWPLSRVWEAA